MLKEFKESMLPSDLITVAAGLAMGLAAFTLIQAIVAYLVAPLISVFVGDPNFELNAFTIDNSEFRYGAAIEAAMIFAFVAGAVYFFAVVPRHRRGHEGVAGGTRACPECTSSISSVAKRCPHCTAVVQPGAA